MYPADMKLHCLGTAGYHPSETRQTSCYLLPESGIVLDAGSGMFRLPPRIETDHLDILLTHSHLDHICGLTFLLSVLYQRPVATVRVWGDPEKLSAIQTHLFSESIFPVGLEVEWMPVLPGQSFSLKGDATVTPFSLEHPGGSIGYRIDWNDHSMAYVTDTTADPTADYVRIVRGVDLLLHECNFRTSQDEWAIKTGHSSTTRVGKTAAAIGAAQNWLVHLNPLETDDDPVGIADAKAWVDTIDTAQDLQVIDF
ncbi:MBL fold metallo-hydrolase [Rosistilla carotiformis]|uniref:MBL fold metallo-hydrolase n=1 Tax=Rosistilla carotiformis TaxID=2528017 RepID=UPI0018D20304|nr:MBL fold metallo-hydrolase [Rosistilla carotiformis]